MSDVTVKAVWSEDLNTCTVTIGRGAESHTYHNLRTKKANLRDWKEPEIVYTVKIPCHAAFGSDYMLCAGHDYIYGYKHPEWHELVFHELEDDNEIMDIPKRKKSKKREEWRQMQLFSAAGEGGGG